MNTYTCKAFRLIYMFLLRLNNDLSTIIFLKKVNHDREGVWRSDIN